MPSYALAETQVNCNHLCCGLLCFGPLFCDCLCCGRIFCGCLYFGCLNLGHLNHCCHHDCHWSLFQHHMSDFFLGYEALSEVQKQDFK